MTRSRHPNPVAAPGRLRNRESVGEVPASLFGSVLDESELPVEEVRGPPVVLVRADVDVAFGVAVITDFLQRQPDVQIVEIVVLWEVELRDGGAHALSVVVDDADVPTPRLCVLQRGLRVRESLDGGQRERERHLTLAARTGDAHGSPDHVRAQKSPARTPSSLGPRGDPTTVG